MKRHTLPKRTLLCLVALLLAFGVGVVPGLAQPPCPPGVPCPPGAERPLLTSDDMRRRLPRGGVSAQAAGGPDNYGYTWADTSFEWVDASSGTAVEGSSGTPIDIGFDFGFYENTYSQLYISQWGYVSFQSSGLDVPYGSIPSSEAPNNVIAPYWTYMSGGQVRYDRGGTAPNRYFVVSWDQVHCDDDEYTFEVVLYESGDILFQYGAMLYNGGYACASAGIEDSWGTDGLASLGSCSTAGTNTAVRFQRPDPAARIGVVSRYQGRFVRADEGVVFDLPIRNTGELGADTYDLTATSGWAASLYAADGITPLTDTDSDGTPDTGAVAQGDAVTVTVKVQVPAGATVGDHNDTAVTILSSLSASVSATIHHQAAVPAPFAQAYRSGADEAMSLLLAHPAGQGRWKATDDGENGEGLAITATGSGFAYFWSTFRGTGTAFVLEAKYALLDDYGQVMRPAAKLSDLGGAVVNTYDLSPAAAVAPDGRVGVTWYRQRYDPSRGTNYNIYFAILDSAGNRVYGPVDVTSNAVWGDAYSGLDVPRYEGPRIVATSDSRFILAWKQTVQRSSGQVQDIHITVRDTQGTVVKAPYTFTSSAAGEDEVYWHPALAQVSGSRALLLWHQESDNNVYYTVLDSSGNTVRPAMRPYADSQGWDPRAVELANGNMLVSWVVWAGQGYCPRYIVLSPAFASIGTPTTLDSPASEGGYPYVSLAADPSNHGILTWFESVDTPSSLYYALVDSAGAVLTPPQIFYGAEGSAPAIITSYAGQGVAPFGTSPTTSNVDGWLIGPDLVFADDNRLGSMRLRFGNRGEHLATTAALSATLSTGLSYESDNLGIAPAQAGGTVTWNLPDLGFIEGGQFDLIVGVPADPPGTHYSLTLSLSSDGPEADASNNTAEVRVVIPYRCSLPLVLKGE